MQWYHYFSRFCAGMFLGNFVPHFIKGVAGDPFPTPFSKPPGRGLSSPWSEPLALDKNNAYKGGTGL